MPWLENWKAARQCEGLRATGSARQRHHIGIRARRWRRSWLLWATGLVLAIACAVAVSSGSLRSVAFAGGGPWQPAHRAQQKDAGSRSSKRSSSARLSSGVSTAAPSSTASSGSWPRPSADELLPGKDFLQDGPGSLWERVSTVVDVLWTRATCFGDGCRVVLTDGATMVSGAAHGGALATWNAAMRSEGWVIYNLFRRQLAVFVPSFERSSQLKADFFFHRSFWLRNLTASPMAFSVLLSLLPPGLNFTSCYISDVRVSWAADPSSIWRLPITVDVESVWATAAEVPAGSDDEVEDLITTWLDITDSQNISAPFRGTYPLLDGATFRVARVELNITSPTRYGNLSLSLSELEVHAVDGTGRPRDLDQLCKSGLRGDVLRFYRLIECSEASVLLQPHQAHLPEHQDHQHHHRADLHRRQQQEKQEKRQQQQQQQQLQQQPQAQQQQVQQQQVQQMQSKQQQSRQQQSQQGLQPQQSQQGRQQQEQEEQQQTVEGNEKVVPKLSGALQQQRLLQQRLLKLRRLRKQRKLRQQQRVERQKLRLQQEKEQEEEQMRQNLPGLRRWVGSLPARLQSAFRKQIQRVVTARIIPRIVSEPSATVGRAVPIDSAQKSQESIEQEITEAANIDKMMEARYMEGQEKFDLMAQMLLAYSPTAASGSPASTALGMQTEEDEIKELVAAPLSGTKSSGAATEALTPADLAADGRAKTTLVQGGLSRLVTMQRDQTPTDVNDKPDGKNQRSTPTQRHRQQHNGAMGKKAASEVLSELAKEADVLKGLQGGGVAMTTPLTTGAGASISSDLLENEDKSGKVAQAAQQEDAPGNPFLSAMDFGKGEEEGGDDGRGDENVTAQLNNTEGTKSFPLHLLSAPLNIVSMPLQVLSSPFHVLSSPFHFVSSFWSHNHENSTSKSSKRKGRSGSEESDDPDSDSEEDNEESEGETEEYVLAPTSIQILAMQGKDVSDMRRLVEQSFELSFPGPFSALAVPPLLVGGGELPPPDPRLHPFDGPPATWSIRVANRNPQWGRRHGKPLYRRARGVIPLTIAMCVLLAWGTSIMRPRPWVQTLLKRVLVLGRAFVNVAEKAIDLMS